jgi:putative ABC transport system permease protein
MVSLARKNLFEDLPRFLVAQAGIIFAVSLVTIQTGILKGFTRSTTQLIDNSPADIWVTSKDMVNFELTLPLSYKLLAQAQQVEGVARAEAIAVSGGIWRNSDGTLAPIKVIGINPDEQLLSLGHLTQGTISDLKQPYQAIVDRSDLDSLNIQKVGENAQIGALTVQLAGITQGIQSNASSPFVLTSLATAKAYSHYSLIKTSAQPLAPSLQSLTDNDPITYILIQAKPGQNLATLQQNLERALPDTHAYTKAEMSTRTRVYWEQRTSIGFILGLGAAIGVIVGVVIVGQILYSSVSDHLREYGTLKAMGASDWVSSQIIIEQAVWMAIFGYLPGIGLGWIVKLWTLNTQGVLIVITPALAGSIFVVTVIMCISAGLFAMQKVNRVDPAIVFKA